MQGLEQRLVNGIRVVRLHYTADPAKREPEWRDEARRGMSDRDWRREYEIDWTVAAGLPVFGDFLREWHVADQVLQPIPGLPIHRGWDFGLCPCCVWVQVDSVGRARVLRELVTWTGRGEPRQQGIERLLPDAVRVSNEWYAGWQFQDWADPAGWAKSQTDEKTCVEIMRQFGVSPRKGPVTFTDRRRAVTELLCRAMGGSAALMVSPICTMVIEGFQGAYRYEEVGQTGRYREDPEKNAWSHPMDALEYVIGGLYRPVSRGREERDEWERESKRRVKKRDRVTGY